MSRPVGRYLRRPRYDATVVDVQAFPYMGFGATVSWIHMAHVAADSIKTPLWFINPDKWPFGGRRTECALDRFVQIPVAEPRVLARTRCAIFNPGDRHNLRRWGYFDELDSPHCAFGYRDGFAGLEAYRRSVLARHYAPTPFARDAVVARSGFLPSSYVAWHVRRGDKVRGPAREDEAVGLKHYARATEKLLETESSAPRHLVICTDSPAVLEEAANSEPVRRLGLEVVFDPREKRWDGYGDLQRAGKVIRTQDMVAEVLTAQKVIEILRGSEILVGCNSSYLFRVAAMLAPSTPAVSLSENKKFRKYFPI